MASQFFTTITQGVKDLGSTIVNGLSNFFQTFFMPTDGHLEARFNQCKGILAEKMGFDSYATMMSEMSSDVEKNLDFGGYIDIGLWTSKMKFFKNLIRGFFYPLILIGNIRFITWLIRGTTFINGGVH